MSAGAGLARVLTACIVAGIAAAGAGAQASRSHDTEQDAFIRRAIVASRPFQSRAQAIRAGYRRLGADFPGMGEHWVQPALIVRGAVDAERPPVLSYVEVDGEPVLVGMAFTVPLGPGDEPPEEPFGRAVWHDHSGSVDEETLLINHPASMHHGGIGFRLSMVHVWTDLPNPDGVLAQNNWTLPYLREGIEAPSHPDVAAARGLSLAHGGRAFYADLITDAVELDPTETAAIRRILNTAAGKAEEAIAEARADGAEGSEEDPFPAIWRGFWDDVREAVRPEAWEALKGLAGR